jgi:hypothetical protein
MIHPKVDKEVTLYLTTQKQKRSTKQEAAERHKNPPAQPAGFLQI